MKRSFLFICLFIVAGTFMSLAQENLNGYKYIIVPKQFEFQKSKDQYQINSLTKFLFERAGFKSIFSEDPYPADLAKNPCLGLKALVVNEKSFLNTKMYIEFYDCQNKVVYATDLGRSKEKEYKKAYHQAIRNTFVAIDTLGYKYNRALIKSNNISKEIDRDNVTKSPVAKVEVNNVAKTENEKTKSDVKKIDTTPKSVTIVHSINGKYMIDVWGECVISEKGDGYSLVGGDENFEFATISKTSKPNLFMIKRVGFKQTQLLELDKNGDLKIDSESGVKIYKRID